MASYIDLDFGGKYVSRTPAFSIVYYYYYYYYYALPYSSSASQLFIAQLSIYSISPLQP